MRPDPAGDRFLMRDGVRIRYRDQGAGPALVLVHGWLLDLTVWDWLQPGWSAHFRVVRLDRRGFGASAGTPNLSTDALDAIALLDVLGIARAAFLGLSQGVRIVLDLAQRAAGRVSALVLDGAPAIDGLPGGPWAEETLVGQYRDLLRAEGPGALRVALRSHPLMRPRTTNPAVRAALDRMIANYSGADLEAPHSAPAVPAALERLHVPTLVINGEFDTAQRRAVGAALARTIGGAESHIVPGAGHLACLDDPGRYGRIVTDFLLRNLAIPATNLSEPS